jgi:hypothetical protein
VAPTQRQKATGTVTLSPTRDGSATEARITISVPEQQPMMLRWAVLPGRCGSGTLPLLSVEQFPTIEVGTNGRGEMRGTAPMALPSSGTYHVNVYWQGQQLTDVMTCANLRLDGGMP